MFLSRKTNIGKTSVLNLHSRTPPKFAYIKKKEVKKSQLGILCFTSLLSFTVGVFFGHQIGILSRPNGRRP
jgi:hypothetical protein